LGDLPRFLHEVGEGVFFGLVEDLKEPVEVLGVFAKDLADEGVPGRCQVNLHNAGILGIPFAPGETLTAESGDGSGDRVAREENFFPDRIDRKGTFMEKDLQNGKVGQGSEARLPDTRPVILHHGVIRLPEKKEKVGAGMLEDFHGARFNIKNLEVKIKSERSCGDGLWFGLRSVNLRRFTGALHLSRGGEVGCFETPQFPAQSR